jgi:hypothetical protein
MSFELAVIGGKRVGLRRWFMQTRALGVELEPRAGVNLDCYSGWLPVRLAVTRADLFDGADRFVTAGPLQAGFEFDLEAFGPGLDIETLEDLDTLIATLVQQNTPTILIDSIRARRASYERSVTDHPDEQRVYFRTTAGRTGADFIAQTVGAAAWALCAGGSLVDLQGEFARAEGDDILAALYHHLDGYFADPAIETGTPFNGWDAR